jgi:hypothetical protein
VYDASKAKLRSSTSFGLSIPLARSLHPPPLIHPSILD